jgi:glutamate-1-semialdehyde 2,1-aminomutase
MKIVAIVQARMGSTRLPNKVMKDVAGIPMIGVLLFRLQKSKKIDQIILATSADEKNFDMVDYVQRLGYKVYLGKEDDVLDRFYKAASLYNADIIVRITGDCPLVDPDIVDSMVDTFSRNTCDYMSNANPPTFPDGLDVEVFTYRSLKIAWEKAEEKFEREHVTPFIRENNCFSTFNFSNDMDLSNSRWTVDEYEDLEVVRSIFENFFPRKDFNWKEVVSLQNKNPNIFMKNKHLIRNEGATMNTGQKLWKRAKKVIPGGNMLLSKRAEMFLPEYWPTYYSKAKGCEVWDLDGRKYIDMSIMGIGTNILGYGHPEVDEVVQRVVSSGNMSTLNCPEEVYLSEKLIELHPWADMVRLSRTGGEANAIAIRIARAASGRDKVAICGYHGWHDWYLSANLGSDKNLDGHHLPGLDPKGVPKGLRGTVLPFKYNDFSGLETLVKNHDIGVIKMEVSRSDEPNNGFLEKVRELATNNNIVLIFDECTSGFRETNGGLHKKYKVDPDMAVFGKALGNGYSITAIIGRRDIMEVAQDTFISSTFWTERIGPAAALKTLEVMEREKSWEQITNTGLQIRSEWQKLADSHKLKISHWGIPSLTGFTIAGDSALIYKTLITQEMLKKGFLVGNSIYVCINHTQEVIDKYFESLDPIFALIRECEDGRDVSKLIQGPICHSGFSRLN